eukprot:GHVT01067503.1.p3 GENE.GHVT01067503.1~~GHVT01067503.1.p3  ORF type:complete len:141 (-),score=15.73 GHVT01067503.1:2699-3121(-)
MALAHRLFVLPLPGRSRGPEMCPEAVCGAGLVYVHLKLRNRWTNIIDHVEVVGCKEAPTSIAGKCKNAPVSGDFGRTCTRTLPLCRKRAQRSSSSRGNNDCSLGGGISSVFNRVVWLAFDVTNWHSIGACFCWRSGVATL